MQWHFFSRALGAHEFELIIKWGVTKYQAATVSLAMDCSLREPPGLR